MSNYTYQIYIVLQTNALRAGHRFKYTSYLIISTYTHFFKEKTTLVNNLLIHTHTFIIIDCIFLNTYIV